jgi:transcription elongation factor GreA
MNKYLITSKGYKKLKAEITDLKTNQRPSIIDAIAKARELGDLKENAEYHSAREKQGMIEARIKDLEGKFSNTQIINIEEFSGKTVRFGATVKLENLDNEKVTTYQIVSDYEANIEKGRISDNSPVARALLGKQEGDEIEIRTPKGIVDYEILEVKFV